MTALLESVPVLHVSQTISFIFYIINCFQEIYKKYFGVFGKFQEISFCFPYLLSKVTKALFTSSKILNFSARLG